MVVRLWLVVVGMDILLLESAFVDSLLFFFSSRRRHTICALVTGVQTCALPIFYDELQELRTGRSSMKGAAAAVLSQNTERRLGLTATPVYNYGIDIFNVMSFLSEGALGTREEFTREWCAGDGVTVREIGRAHV